MGGFRDQGEATAGSELSKAFYVRLYRGLTPKGPWTQLNTSLIASPTPGSTAGHNYEWLDTDVVTGQAYWYQLEAVDVHGAAQVVGLISAQAGPGALRTRLWLLLVVH